jgi:hypothetical protein
MATLNLTKCWINLATTGESVTAQRIDNGEDTRAVAGRVATYSGGRQRAVTQEGVMGTWPVTLTQVSAADTATLRSWMGQTILVRDSRGRKEYGVVLEVPRSAWKDQLDTYDVALTLQLVSYDESV